jgi:multidrug efflux system membrane fusion protein
MSVPGTVDQILVQRGDRVKQGQALLRLDRSGFALGIAQAEAGLAAAKVGLDSLSTEKERFDRLLSNKAIPKATYDKVRAQYDGAAAQVALAEVGLKMAQKAYRDSELRAPYDGVITMVLKEVGEYAPAMPPTMLLKIVDTSALEVQVFLPESEATHVQVGQPAQVQIDSAGASRGGRVIFVSERIEPGSQTFEVRVGLANPDDQIKAGAFARVELVRSQDDAALLVPLRSVQRADGKTFVFLAVDGRARRTQVTLGETAGDRILVTQGLQAGAEVIVSAVAELTDGQSVQPEQG